MYKEPEETLVLPPNPLFVPYRRVITLREIWSQKYISLLNSAFSRPLPSIPAGIRGFEEITLIRGKNFYAQSLSHLHCSIFSISIERIRREKKRERRDCTDNFTPTEREGSGMIRWVTTWELKRWLPSLSAKSDIVNHLSNTMIRFLYNQMEGRPNK